MLGNLVEAVLDDCIIECGPAFLVKRGHETEEKVGMPISRVINPTFRGSPFLQNLQTRCGEVPKYQGEVPSPQGNGSRLRLHSPTTEEEFFAQPGPPSTARWPGSTAIIKCNTLDRTCVGPQCDFPVLRLPSGSQAIQLHDGLVVLG